MSICFNLESKRCQLEVQISCELEVEISCETVEIFKYNLNK